MSGHSKWAQIKRQKGAADQKRSSLFTKLANTITVAARQGGDPSMNFKLRLAVDRAREFSMPKENIDRAIKRGTGELGGQAIEEVVYEAYGPAGVALFMTTLTDNKNRTIADIRHIVSRYDGKLGGANSVAHLFAPKGVIRIERANVPAQWETLELRLIDAGAEDIQDEPEGITILTPPHSLLAASALLKSAGIALASEHVEMTPLITLPVTDEPTKQKIEKCVEELENLDDVEAIATNAVFSS